ncbi:hypothetical protein K435DRAFT_915094, partial [Dendrothele bispora CBS 962.96]
RITCEPTRLGHDSPFRFAHIFICATVLTFSLLNPTSTKARPIPSSQIMQRADSRPITPESDSQLANSLDIAANTIDDVTLAEAKSTKGSKPEPPDTRHMMQWKAGFQKYLLPLAGQELHSIGKPIHYLFVFVSPRALLGKGQLAAARKLISYGVYSKQKCRYILHDKYKQIANNFTSSADINAKGNKFPRTLQPDQLYTLGYKAHQSNFV